MSEVNETIFSKIIRREIPAKIVYETDNILAFEDINPQAAVHVLIIPKKIIPTTDDIQVEDGAILQELLLAVPKIAKILNLKSGYRLINNCKSDGGQEVNHLHFHLLGGERIGPLRS